MKVGFIGLGTMGQHMAANLQKAGHALVVHDAREAAAKDAVARGAMWAASPKAVAAASEAVFTSLPGPPEVEAVVLGAHGILAGMNKGAAYFDLSTNSPTLVRRLAPMFAEKGAHMLDAPVSGGPQGARSGKMAIWVGGERAVYDRFKPVLDAMGDQVSYIGEIGAGSVAKLANNCAGYTIQAAIAEVFALGVKGGVDPLALWEAIRGGAVGRRRTYDNLVDQFLPAKYEPASFALRLAHKDVTLATQLGRDLGVPMRLSNMALADMTEAMNRGWENKDSRIAMVPQLDRSGVTVRVSEERIKAALSRDPASPGDPKRS